MQSNSLKIEQFNIDDLRAYERTLRTHTPAQRRKAASLIRQFDQVLPIIADQNGVIIDGHLIWEVMKEQGYDQIAVVVAANRTAPEIRSLRLALNRLPQETEWNQDALKIEFEELLDLNFGLELTGFDDVEIDNCLAIDPASTTPEDNPLDGVDLDSKPVSATGDIWIMDSHKLMCGDILEQDVVAQLMGNDRAQIVITDPPFNVPINGHVCGTGSIKHEEFAMASGEMSQAQFTNFLATSLKHMAQFSLDGSLHYIFMDWRHTHEIQTAGMSVFDELKAICVWNKNNGGMGALYRSKHEFVFVFKKGNAPHINNIELGKHGRNRTTVWDYAGVNSFRPGRLDDLRMHPTVKPVAMIADALLDTSNRGDVVLDGFGGSGTTLIAAEQVGRCARLIEISPAYVDVTVRRWQKATGGVAVHAKSGLTFEEIEVLRSRNLLLLPSPIANDGEE